MGQVSQVRVGILFVFDRPERRAAPRRGHGGIGRHPEGGDGHEQVVVRHRVRGHRSGHEPQGLVGRRDRERRHPRLPRMQYFGHGNCTGIIVRLVLRWALCGDSPKIH